MARTTKANLSSLNVRLGPNIRFQQVNPRRLTRNLGNKVTERVLQAFSALDEVRREDPSSLVNVDLPTLASRWGIFKLRFVSLYSMMKTLEAVAILEYLDSTVQVQPPKYISATKFRKEAAKFGCTSKSLFLDSFGLHPQVCSNVWNRIEPPFRAKPTLLLKTLAVLMAQDRHSACTFASRQRTNSKWVQRMLVPISALYDTVVSRILCHWLSIIDPTKC